ncbi:MAG: DUF3343 domain-containing protein [Spirochaetia bacterium]
MPESSVELLVVLPGIHQTLSAEQTLKRQGVAVTLVPTPPVVKTGCGFSLLAGAEKREKPPWWEALGLPAVLYRVVMREGRRKYEEIDRREGAGVPPAGDPLQKGDGGSRSG